MTSISILQNALGYQFRKPELLHQALCHKSALNHKSILPPISNERLEFLGDRVLGLVIAELLFNRQPAEPEGRMARRLTALVNQTILAEIARQLDISAHLILGNAALGDNIAERDGPLSDALEAIIGAIYLDGGMVSARKFITFHWQDFMDEKNSDRRDAKTRLQEWAMAQGLPLPHYSEFSRTGPDHAPEFRVTVQLPGYKSAIGSGHNKRIAEKAAAELLYQLVTAKPAKKNLPK